MRPDHTAQVWTAGSTNHTHQLSVLPVHCSIPALTKISIPASVATPRRSLPSERIECLARPAAVGPSSRNSLQESHYCWKKPAVLEARKRILGITRIRWCSDHIGTVPAVIADFGVEVIVFECRTPEIRGADQR
jgi:hypothetical protein